MRQQTRASKEPAEKVVQDIRPATRKHYIRPRRRCGTRYPRTSGSLPVHCTLGCITLGVISLVVSSLA